MDATTVNIIRHAKGEEVDRGFKTIVEPLYANLISFFKDRQIIGEMIVYNNDTLIVTLHDIISIKETETNIANLNKNRPLEHQWIVETLLLYHNTNVRAKDGTDVENLPYYLFETNHHTKFLIRITDEMKVNIDKNQKQEKPVYIIGCKCEQNVN